MLNLVSRRSAREIEVVLPAFARIAEVGIDIRAVKYVAGAIGIEQAVSRDWKRGERMHPSGLIVPEQAFFAERDAANPAAAALEIVQHDLGRQVRLCEQMKLSPGNRLDYLK